LLSKYVGVLLIVSLAGFLLATRRPRGFVPLLGACALAAVLFSPVVVWNAHHDWTSFRYQFVSRHHGAGFDLSKLGLYLGSQMLYLSPLLGALVAATALRLGPWSFGRERAVQNFLWWLAAPTLG